MLSMTYESFDLADFTRFVTTNNHFVLLSEEEYQKLAELDLDRRIADARAGRNMHTHELLEVDDE
jgi:hypothetical protein